MTAAILRAAMRRLAPLLALVALLAAPAGAEGATTYVVEGRGWGHGVGLSQYGALGFAERGWSYRRILTHYYRGTTLGILPNRRVRVLVAEGKASVVVGSKKPFRRIAKGERMTLKAGDRRLKPATLRENGGTIRYEPGARPLRVDGSPYRGALIVYAEAGRVYVVNELSLDHYLRGVVPWEMPHEWLLEALKAQAVVARSYTLATLKPGTRFDLYSDTRSQVYGGIRAEKASTNLAVASTAGRVVLWNGTVATTFYHSTSGGRTAAVADAWPKARAVPYLVSVRSPFEQASKHYRWPALSFTPAELGARVGAGPLRDVRVVRNGSGRVAEAAFVGARTTKRLTGQDLRDLLGLRSTFFEVGVMQLERAAAAVPAGAPVQLSGFVRGLAPVTLERSEAGGPWSAVRRLRLAPTGRFRTTVRPDRPTAYRLVSREQFVTGGTVLITTR